VEIDPSTQKAKLDAGRYSIENLKALAEQRAQYLLAQQQHQRQRDLAAAAPPAKKTCKPPRPS
jgi:macrolide-specific efflux system membrane fusion protein